MSVRVTVDTIDKDLAKIVETNNPEVAIDLVIDPQTKNTKVITLHLLDISTECLDANYSSDLSQNIF